MAFAKLSFASASTTAKISYKVNRPRTFVFESKEPVLANMATPTYGVESIAECAPHLESPTVNSSPCGGSPCGGSVPYSGSALPRWDAFSKSHDALRHLVEEQDVKLRELASLNRDIWFRLSNGEKIDLDRGVEFPDHAFGYVRGMYSSGQNSPGRSAGLGKASSPCGSPFKGATYQRYWSSEVEPKVSETSEVGRATPRKMVGESPKKPAKDREKCSEYVDDLLSSLNPAKKMLKKTKSMAQDESHLRYILQIKDEKEKKEQLHAFEFNRQSRMPLLQAEEKVDALMAIVILMNVAQIGLSSDFGRNWVGWLFIDAIFALCFLAELIFKICVHGCAQYLCGPTKLWNYFDIVIVFLAVMEILWTCVAGDTFRNGPSISFFRMLRLCRLTRIVRLLRYPVFKELLMMVDGMVGGVRTLFWAIVLLLAPLYAIAIVLRETIGASEEHAVVASPFRTLPLSMFNIFRCVTGDCANEKGEPIFVWLYYESGWFYAVFYCAVILLTNFGLFNVIIAIYVENTVVAAKSNERLQRQRRLNDQERLAVNCFRLVQALVLAERSRSAGDENRRRFSVTEAVQVPISPSSFKEALETPEVQMLLDNLDILAEDREDLFEILDADGNGELAVGEIIKGITKLRGDARRSDIITANLTIKALISRVDRMQEILTDQHGHILAQSEMTRSRVEQTLKRMDAVGIPMFSEPIRL